MTKVSSGAAIEIHFIPILCAAPLLYAERYGVFEAHGLSVKLRAAMGWSGIKGLLAHGRADVAHVLSPMPLAARLGLDGKPMDMCLSAIQNVNGQAITLARKHEHVRDISGMRGFVFGVPYRFSMQYYLLCDLLAKNGLDPLTDVSIVEVVPPRMPYYMEKGRVDGVLAPEPFNQIIVDRGNGFIYALSRDLWPGHPCCAFGATRRFIEARPDDHTALLRSILAAQRALREASIAERRRIARAITELGFWSACDIGSIEQALTGVFRDGRGGERSVPDRIDFMPFARTEHAVWILSQMQRWGQLQREVDYGAVAAATWMPDLVRSLAEEVGFPGYAPLPDGLSPTSAEGALAQMKQQPFCAFRPRVDTPARYDLSPGACDRLRVILAELASAASDGAPLALEITSDDEIGWLEDMLNGTLQTLRFAREAQEERLELEQRARGHEATIKAQEDLIRELSTPILPVLEGVLVLPIVGDVDAVRGDRITEALLAAVSREHAEVVLIDITGMPSVRREILDRLCAMARAVSLLGAECVVVGVSPSVAQAIAAAGDDLSPAVLKRDLRGGVEYAMRRARRRAAD